MFKNLPNKQKTLWNVIFLVTKEDLKICFLLQNNGIGKLQMYTSQNYDFTFTNLLKNEADWG